MVRKVGCPGYKPMKPFTNGVYCNGYYYLLDRINEKLLKMEIDHTDDAVIMVCNREGNYTFYNDQLQEVEGSNRISRETLISTPSLFIQPGPEKYKTHRICTATKGVNDYVVVSTVSDDEESVALEFFNSELELLNNVHGSNIQGIAWDRDNKILVLISSGGGSTISIYEIDHDPLLDKIPNHVHPSHPVGSQFNIITADGIFGWDKRECLYLDGFLWIVDNHYRMLEKRFINDLYPPLPTSLHTMALSIESSGGENSTLYNYQGNVLAVNKINASWENCKFNLFNSSSGALIKSKSFQYNLPRIVVTKNEYIYFLKPTGELCQLNNNLEVVKTVDNGDLVGLMELY